MNPIWAFLFKDKYRTPFSVYKMSLAELLVLLGIIGGSGYAITSGVQWLLTVEGLTEQISE